MEDESVVETGIYEADEVVNSIRCGFRIKLRLHNTAVCHCDGYDRICHYYLSFDKILIGNSYSDPCSHCMYGHRICMATASYYTKRINLVQEAVESGRTDVFR